MVKPSKSKGKMTSCQVLPSTSDNKKARSDSRSSTKSTSTPAKLYSSFLPIPVLLPCPVLVNNTSSSSSSSSTSPVTHYIYTRPHRLTAHSSFSSSSSSSSTTTEQNRTIFIANLPIDMTERALRSIFTRWGVIESLQLTMKSTGGGDVLEQAVKGLSVDEDEDDENEVEEGEGRAEDGEEEKEKQDEPTAHSRAQFTGPGEKPLPRSKRPRRRPTTSLFSSVPSVTPLPALSPRSTPFGLSGLSTALITYLDPISLTRIFSITNSILKPIPVDLSSSPSATSGLAYYAAKHSLASPSLLEVREHADSAMARYDHLHSLLLSSRAKKSGAGALVDEDGFTVVVRSGRYGRTGGRGPDGAGVAVAKRGFASGNGSAEEGSRKKKGRGAGELPDFYKFQSIDRKRKELADLRAKFEQDKRKVEQLKKTQRFKPY